MISSGPLPGCEDGIPAVGRDSRVLSPSHKAQVVDGLQAIGADSNGLRATACLLVAPFQEFRGFPA